jgi:uncharacterized surface protein with fasciclin (FAS1) repeats
MNQLTKSTQTFLLPLCILSLGAFAGCTTVDVEAPQPSPASTSSTQSTTTEPMTSSASASADMSASRGDIATIATASGQFTTLLGAINAAGLYTTLTEPGPITVFAPTEAAFAKLPAGTLDKLLRVENRDALRQLISYHVVSGRVASADLTGKTLTNRTLAGSSVSIDGRSGVMVNNARVVQADIQASNGVVHAIDTVLMPTDMMALK